MYKWQVAMYKWQVAMYNSTGTRQVAMYKWQVAMYKWQVAMYNSTGTPGKLSSTLYRYTGQVASRFGDSGSCEEYKWCRNVIVEADIHLGPLNTSILDI